MLSNVIKTTNMSATSKITDGNGNDHVVMNMVATFSTEGGVNISQNIRDKELYRENEEAVNADFDAFRAAIMKETEG